MKAGATERIVVSLDLKKEVDSVIFTLQGKSKVTKTFSGNEYNGIYLINLSQEDTEKLQGSFQIEAQINYSDLSVKKSNIETKYISPTLATEKITGSEATDDSVDIILKEIKGEVALIISPESSAELIEAVTELFNQTKEVADGVRRDADNGVFNGEDGFSPTVEVETQTEDTYILRITDKTGSYDTPNLKGQGGGGTSDYNNLTNKPSYNGTTLQGAMTDSDLNIATKTELRGKQDALAFGVGLKKTNNVVDAKLSAQYGNLLKTNNNGEMYVSGTDIAKDTYLLSLLPYTSEMRIGLASDGIPNALATKLELALKQDITDNSLQTTNKTIPSAINEVNSIAKGANQALSYANYSAMVTAFNLLDDDVYNVGQNVMIVTVEVPDLWVSGIESTSVPYTYVDDATIISSLQTNGYIQVGYYKLSMLETQKVDLTNYAQKSDLDNYLAKNNTSQFTPTGDYNPSTKKYVDDTFGGVNQVPPSTSQDADKVLSVNAQGVAEWKDAQGGEIPAPTLQTRGGIYAQTVQDTSGMQEVVVGSNGKAYTDISSKENKTTIVTNSTDATATITLANNTEYRFTQDLSSLTLTLPQTIDTTFIASIVFSSGSTATAMTYDSSIKWSGDDVTSGSFVPQASKVYNIVLWHDGINVNAVVRGV